MLSTFVDRFFQLSRKQLTIIVALMGLLFFVPFIGQVHLFDWDEINYAEIAREMRITGEYFMVQVDFQPFFEKPPLFAWLQNITYTFFGIHEFAARLPNAIFGIFSLVLVFQTGARLKGNTFGLLWVLLYFGTFLPHFFFKSGIIDPVFNFFIFSSILFLIKTLENKDKKTIHFFYVGILNGLGVLAKGPVSFLLLSLTVASYWILFRRSEVLLKINQILALGAGVALMAGIWFGPETFKRGPIFIYEFVIYMIDLASNDVATHGQPFFYHPVVIFIGCFPISIFALRHLVKADATQPKDIARWMLCLFWVVLIVFSIVKTKIVNYSSMTYFPLSFLAALAIEKYIVAGKVSRAKFFLIMGLIMSVPIMLAPFALQHKELIMPFMAKDPFGQDTLSILDVPVWMSSFGLILVIGVIWSYRLFAVTKIKEGVVVYAFSAAIFLNLGLNLLMPPIEYAVQGPAIEYYSRYAGQDVYLYTSGLKSYGRIFYFQKQPWQSQFDEQQLLDGKFDKPVYFISKTNSDHELKKRPEITFLEKKGGYLLYVKKPQL